MISVETLDLVLSIAEGELIEDIIIALLASPTLAVFFEKFPRLKKSIGEDLPRYREQLKRRLQEGDVPKNLADEVLLYQQTQRLNPVQLTKKISEIIQQLESKKSSFLSEAIKLADHTSPFTAAQHSLFLHRWRLSLVVQGTTLNKQLLEDERDKLLAEIQARMALSGELSSALAENDTAAGKLWDMSRGALKSANGAIITKYSAFLESQPELLALAMQLGRSRQAKSVPHDEAPIELWRTQVREPSNVPEEVEGLHLSDDILRLLPPELAVLGLTEVEYEFYRKLVEKQLMTYRLQGDAWREKTIERPITHHDYDVQPRGPFIVCVDASGSMGGFNEQCAKAFCLALMRIALADNRRCFIQMFTDEVIHYELSGKDGLDQATRFLSQRFHGGTDLTKCLNSAIAKMTSVEGYDADTVVISDFIAQRLPNDLIENIKKLQNQQNQCFHGVAMSSHGKPSILRIFDHIWRFDTGIKSRMVRYFKR